MTNVYGRDIEPEPNLEKLLPEIYNALSDLPPERVCMWGITLFIGISDIMNTTQDKETESLARHWVEESLKAVEGNRLYNLFFEDELEGHA